MSCHSLVAILGIMSTVPLYISLQSILYLCFCGGVLKSDTPTFQESLNFRIQLD